MMNGAKYTELSINAKLHCVDVYLNKVCPYGYDEETTLCDIEYDIKEWLKDSNYAIDIDGNWYERIFHQI